MELIIDKFLENHKLSGAEYLTLLEGWENQEISSRLAQEAVRIRDYYYGRKIFTRGLIEFTNYCKNNCYYCGIRNGNRNAGRYRLTEEEILKCCHMGYEMGHRTFVLQGGEDPWFTDEKAAAIIRRIKGEFPDCAVTLSIGEKSFESYRLFREAGADRYLLRHETADETLYRSLHPAGMSLKRRKQCLYDLKELGYQVGAGFMVGAPGQTLAHLAKDLVFLQELQPQMAGIGPFIPHHDTKYGDEKAGSIELTLFLLSVIRIMLPTVLLPATTALGTLDPTGREKGFMAGANVVMPNLSPMEKRRQYELYDNKIGTREEDGESMESLARRAQCAGCRLVSERGDAVKL